MSEIRPAEPPSSGPAARDTNPQDVRAPARPRVLHVFETWLPVASGYTHRSWQIVAAQAQTGVCDPYICVSSRQALHRHRLGDMPVPDGVAGLRLVPVSTSERRLRRLRPFHIDGSVQAAAIASACRDWQIDIVHCHWSSAIGTAAHRAAAATGAALVGEVRFDLAGAMMSETVRMSLPGLERLLRARFDRYLAGADGVVAASHSLAGLVQRSTARHTPVEVMPNAVDTDVFQPDLEAGRRLRREHGLDDAFIVGSTTNMLRYEGIDRLLKAIETLKGRIPELRVVLVGGGTQQAALEARARSRGLPVNFVGRVSRHRIPDYLNMLDVFVVPRRATAVTRYASPIKLGEAMACGLPCIASALGDIPDMLGGGRGWSLPADDPQALVEALEQLAGDAEMRANLGRRARAWALAQPDWSALAHHYGRFYERVLGARERAR